MTPRWYCVSRDGLATLCSGEANARDVASENDIAWPLNAPHCAVLLVDTTEIERLRADRDCEKRMRKASDDLATDLRLALEAIIASPSDTGLAHAVLQQIQ